MANAADYSIIVEGKKEGNAVQDELIFNLPDTAILSVRSILTFTFSAHGAPVHIDITMNGFSVGWYELEEYFGTFTRPVKKNVLLHGKNVLRFFITNDDYVVIGLYHVILHWYNKLG